MADDPLLGIVGAGSGVTVMAVAFGIWDRFFRRKETVESAQKSDRDHMLTYLDDRGKGALERMDRDLSRNTEDLSRERTRSAELQQQVDAGRDERETDRRQQDLGWDTARDWRVRCFAVLHELENARQIVDGDRAAAGKPSVEWFPEVLPSLEDIRPDNFRRAADKKTWKGQARLPEA